MQAVRQLTAATQAGLFVARCTSASLQSVSVRHFAAPGAEGRQKGNNAAAAASAGGFVRTEAGLNELYMRSVEPKPHAVYVLTRGVKINLLHATPSSFSNAGHTVNSLHLQAPTCARNSCSSQRSGCDIYQADVEAASRP
jgi:hypothetical protein